MNFQQAPEPQQQQQSLVVPPCPCGAERQFEYQIMPSLLHVLDVDKHATQQQQQDNNVDNDSPPDLDVIMSADYGGMNWGAIAVYTCTKNADCDNQEDFLILQASVDETPCKRAVADAPVFIKEGQTFDALTNEGDLLAGCNADEDDDDDTVATESDLVFTLDG